MPEIDCGFIVCEDRINETVLARIRNQKYSIVLSFCLQPIRRNNYTVIIPDFLVIIN